MNFLDVVEQYENWIFFSGFAFVLAVYIYLKLTNQYVDSIDDSNHGARITSELEKAAIGIEPYATTYGTDD